MTTKETLRRLVDELPDSQLDIARRFLQYLRDTVDPVLLAFLEAPEDDELETEEERASVAQAKKDFEAGRVIRHEELKRELGL